MQPSRSVTSSADFVAIGFRAEKAKVRRPGVYKSLLTKVIYSFLLGFQGLLSRSNFPMEFVDPAPGCCISFFTAGAELHKAGRAGAEERL